MSRKYEHRGGKNSVKDASGDSVGGLMMIFILMIGMILGQKRK